MLAADAQSKTCCCGNDRMQVGDSIVTTTPSPCWTIDISLWHRSCLSVIFCWPSRPTKLHTILASASEQCNMSFSSGDRQDMSPESLFRLAGHEHWQVIISLSVFYSAALLSESSPKHETIASTSKDWLNNSQISICMRYRTMSLRPLMLMLPRRQSLLLCTVVGILGRRVIVFHMLGLNEMRSDGINTKPSLLTILWKCMSILMNLLAINTHQIDCSMGTCWRLCTPSWLLCLWK